MLNKQCAVVADKKIQPQVAARLKADPAERLEIGAPIPGLVANLSVRVGHKVQKGEKLLTLEAMKIYTTIPAPADGVVDELLVKPGDTVESKDLLLTLRS